MKQEIKDVILESLRDKIEGCKALVKYPYMDNRLTDKALVDISNHYKNKIAVLKEAIKHVESL